MLQYKPNNANNVSKTKQYGRTTVHVATDTQNYTSTKCPVYPQKHLIYKCNTFMTAKPSERLNLTKRAKICFNCLRTTHNSNQCTNEKTCKNCGLKHHTLLHLNIRKVSTTEGEDMSNDQGKGQKTQSTTSHLGASHSQNVILYTALVRVSGKNGQTVLCRALLDSGSQSNFITT